MIFISPLMSSDISVDMFDISVDIFYISIMSPDISVDMFDISIMLPDISVDVENIPFLYSKQQFWYTENGDKSACFPIEKVPFCRRFQYIYSANPVVKIIYD